MSELIWGRIGFASTGILFGFVYAAAVSILAYPFNSEVNFAFVFQVFVSMFGIAGLLFGNAIIKSAQGFIYALYVVYGYIIGVLGFNVVTTEFFPNKSGALFFVFLGGIAGIICLFGV